MFQSHTTPNRRVKIRQCVGCRDEEDAKNLFRFVAPSSSHVDSSSLLADSTSVPAQEGAPLLFDPFSKVPGRGAYVHLRESCLASALKGGFSRSFRSKLNLPTSEMLVKMIQQGLHRRLVALIRAGFKSSDAFIGETKIAASMKANQLDILIIANDAGEATQSKYRLNAQRKEIRCCDALFSRHELGSYIGADSLSLLGFRGQLATSFITELDLYLTAASF